RRRTSTRKPSSTSSPATSATAGTKWSCATSRKCFPSSKPSRPMIGILGALQESIDNARSLVGRGIGQKRANFIGGRQPADQVQMHAPQKLRIVARLRRRNAERLELVPDMLVDDVVARQRGI